MNSAMETLTREMFFRCMRDSDGKLLPSEAAKLVAKILHVSPVEVILIAGKDGLKQNHPDDAGRKG